MAQEPSGSGSDPKDKPKGESAQTPRRPSAAAGPPAPPIDPEQLKQLLQALASAGGLPIAVTQTPLTAVDLRSRLKALVPVTVAFPPCSDVLLALINTQTLPPDKDDITKFFEEYFTFEDHQTVFLPTGAALHQALDPALLNCLAPVIIGVRDNARERALPAWPSPWCLPPSCVTLNGNRRVTPLDLGERGLKRLCLGDVVWLFFIERMGIFKILGVLLDDYATRGSYPISNGSLQQDLRDDVTALVLEAMCRQAKAGLSSTVRDRDATYRRVLGWTSDVGRPLDVPAQVNKGTSQLFHKFLRAAIGFNTAKRLAVAIRGTTTPASAASLATLVEISDTLTQLKQRFETFHYGRSYYNTLSGIVWAIAGLTLLRELRTTLGIPAAFDQPHEFVPAAYDLLVLKRTPTQTETNRYEGHKDCAELGRNLLLDIEVLNEKDTNQNGELERWLTQVEGDIEGYRKAYRDLTGIDLGVSGTSVTEQPQATPAIEQQA